MNYTIRKGMKRILFVMYQMGMGGSERLVYELARRLNSERFASSVAWFEGEEVLPEFGALKIPLFRVAKTKRLDFGTMQHLADIVARNEIDIVVAQHFMPLVYSYYACRDSRRTALIFTAHSRWELEELSWKWRLLGSQLLRSLCASIGVSGDVSDAIRATFWNRPRNVVTIENGVELRGPVRDANRTMVRMEMGIPSDCKVIGMVANFKKVKNHLFMLKAFAEVARAEPNVRLVLVGRGFDGEPDNTEPLIRNFVHEHALADRIEILGYRPDVHRLLDMVDVFCLTSLTEGLPISLIEAMAAGLAVVGTNVPGIRDVIENGRDGVIVELGNIRGLVVAVKSLLTDTGLRTSLGRAAMEKADQRFSIERCVASYERLFLSCRPLR